MRPGHATHHGKIWRKSCRQRGSKAKLRGRSLLGVKARINRKSEGETVIEVRLQKQFWAVMQST